MLGRPFVLLFSLKEADFQGCAYASTQESPASASQGLEMGLIHHPQQLYAPWLQGM